ncbi:MAG TPA: hypothetical protein VKJ45_01050, partial [Blastocatellia bacterium]|nr:hypothetical protein [Blastocatellia bacterium]
RADSSTRSRAHSWLVTGRDPRTMPLAPTAPIIHVHSVTKDPASHSKISTSLQFSTVFVGRSGNSRIAAALAEPFTGSLTRSLTEHPASGAARIGGFANSLALLLFPLFIPELAVDSPANRTSGTCGWVVAVSAESPDGCSTTGGNTRTFNGGNKRERIGRASKPDNPIPHTRCLRDAADLFNSTASTPATPSNTADFSQIFNKNPARVRIPVEAGAIDP